MEKIELGLIHYAHFRPHQALGGATPAEIYFGRAPSHLSAIPPPRGRPRAAIEQFLEALPSTPTSSRANPGPGTRAPVHLSAKSLDGRSPSPQGPRSRRPRPCARTRLVRPANMSRPARGM